MKVFYEEHSKSSGSGKTLVMIFVLALLGAIGYTIYLSLTRNEPFLSWFFILGMSLFIILKQAVGQYTYRLTDTAFVIEEKTLIRTKRYEFKYEDIDGIYPFKQEMFGQLKYRYKYRLSNSTDTRQVWAMCYSFVSGKKIKHGRVLIKAEEAFFETLEAFLPGRVRVPQEDVVFHAVVREDAFIHGENFKEYWEKVQNSKGAEDDAE